ncbi:hypothetical protein TNIN_476861 [Trichonephila inaurata madagascariensis]|uniref:Uncharacterized protein n=1 Tax=Trichonephila inaurata madagascariensis TaxID=2747483 RepID=A0A8X7CS74_9ARAC|nr:hypothetical protein TNIN_476861 [Trichonephila inaurata madagascariensis]
MDNLYATLNARRYRDFSQDLLLASGATIPRATVYKRLAKRARAALIDDYLEEEKIHRIIDLRDRCDGRHCTPSITSRDPLSVNIVPFRRIGAVENVFADQPLR